MKIDPALSPEEWAAVESELAGRKLNPKTDHGLAAVALYRNPFGFTREDVARLGALIQALDRAETAQELLVELIVLDPEPWRSLAARIEALLPPEGK